MTISFVSHCVENSLLFGLLIEICLQVELDHQQQRSDSAQALIQQAYRYTIYSPID